MKKWLTLIFVATLVLVISACGGNDEDSSKDDNQDQNGDKDVTENQEDGSDEETLTVTLNDVDGNEAAEATLTEEDDGVKITLKGDGFPKEEAKHAFHIHEKGICEPRDFESAGGHYNPTDKKHGKEDVDGQHAGDFDNIEVSAEGKVDVEFTTDEISLDENAENTVFSEDGTSFVVHDGPDDYKSQPAGDAGDRIACGVIAEPK